jgi:hypothetical protein
LSLDSLEGILHVLDGLFMSPETIGCEGQIVMDGGVVSPILALLDKNVQVALQFPQMNLFMKRSMVSDDDIRREGEKALNG